MNRLKERVPGYIQVNGGWTINLSCVQSVFNYSIQATIPYKNHLYYGWANIVAFITPGLTYYGFRRIAKTQGESYHMENVDVFDDFENTNSIAFEMQISVEDIVFYCMKTSDFVDIISSRKVFNIAAFQVEDIANESWIDLFPKTFEDYQQEFTEEIEESLYYTHNPDEAASVTRLYRAIWEAGLDDQHRKQATEDLQEYLSKIKR